MTTTDLALPPSRVAGVVNGVIDAAHRLTKPVFLDVGNVPSKGPLMLVGNHQLLGHAGPALARARPRGGTWCAGPRTSRRLPLRDPLWRRILTSCGAVLGTRENGAALLTAGEPFLVFPGGAGEVYKRRNQCYQLLWGQRSWTPMRGGRRSPPPSGGSRAAATSAPCWCAAAGRSACPPRPALLPFRRTHPDHAVGRPGR
jgi:hypothetical protein